MKLTAVTKLCFATGLSLSCSFAGTPTIGVASAVGTFSVNDAKVEGNANIFNGSQIRTDVGASRVYLQNGAALTLGTYSAGTLYKDHVVLQQGSAKVDGVNMYSIQTGNLRIQSSDALTTAAVRLEGSKVQVAAFSGSVNVLNRRGILLKRVTAGTASEIQYDATATGGQSGATAGQSGATAQTGASSGAYEARRRRIRETELYLTLGTALGGLGLAVDAILQPGSGPAPTSPGT
jgi:hypothetical protein